ncbi:unnamed protein product [Cochlearia groenlandica]
MFDWIHRNSRLPLALSIVELLVDMDCQGCERKVRKAISKLDGVDTIEIDVDRQKVTVTGYVDREDVLKMVKRTGRIVEFWPFPYDGYYYGDYYNNNYDSSQHFEQYNHEKIPNHAENMEKYELYDDSFTNSNGYRIRPSQKVDENALHLFSDDNVHACVVM